MSLQYCSITGEALQEPVVSKKSGHIFEKRIIEKQIQATGSCPITDQPLELTDLVPVKLNDTIKPRPNNATSIPNMISILQSEWDVVMLDTYNLKQHLETVRQELSHALYQHDAACRVIARVIRERDEARKELSDLYEKLGVNPQEQNGSSEKTGLPSDVAQVIEETSQKLNKQRKKNKKDAAYQQSFIPSNVVSTYVPIDTVALHSTTNPGITASQIHPEQDIIGTGGVDGSVILYDKQTQKILHKFEAHKKQINDLIFTNFDEKIRVYSAGDDGYVYGFEYDLESKNGKQVYQQKYPKAVTAIAVLPINYVFASACSDGTFAFHDARENKELSVVKEYENSLSFKSLRILPDGHLAALGANDGSVVIWNIIQNNLVRQLKDADGNGDINTLAFSENGYILAAGSKKDSSVRIWDLRHGTCAKVFKDIVAPQHVSFDYSATILAVVGETQVKLFDTKTYEPISTTKAHKDTITSINFSQKTKYFVTSSLDRHLYIHSTQ